MVTIIIPCYNYACFLPEAIESALVQRSLPAPVEVIVVDDGSTDDTAAVAARYERRIHYFKKTNAGLSAARNTGMEHASHELVVFLDADDMLAPDAVSVLIEAWGKISPPPAVLAGRDLAVDRQGKRLNAVVESGAIVPVNARDLVFRNRFAPGVLANRHALLKLGGFDPALRASEDRDMWIRVAARYPVFMLDRVVLLKRDHGFNMSRAARQQTACIQQVLAKAFATSELKLTARDRRLAEAVCSYQSALMYADAGDHGMAALQMMRSILKYPIGSLQEAAVPALSRMRGLAGICLEAVKRNFTGSCEKRSS